METSEKPVKVTESFTLIKDHLEPVPFLGGSIAICCIMLGIHSFLAHGILSFGLIACAIIFGAIALLARNTLQKMQPKKNTILKRLTNLEKQLQVVN